MHVNPGHLNGVVGGALANGLVEVRMTDGAVRACCLGAELREAGAVLREGDRVVVAEGENGILRGEIRRIRAEPRPAPEPVAPRASLITRSRPDGLKPGNLRIDRDARPDWPTGAECMPEVGDVVYCTAGLATVLHVLGRTGNGSRLLELRLTAAGRGSFFASGSNVLMAPRPQPPRPAEGTAP